MLFAKMAFIAGKNYRWRDLQFYAMNGAICVHDEETGEFYVKSRRDMFAVYMAFKAEVDAHRAEHGLAESERMADLRSYLQKLSACLQEAKDQGDFNDPTVCAWYSRHAPHKRSAISMAGTANFSAGSPEGVLAGTAAGAMQAMAAGAGLPRGRFNPDTVRPDRVIRSRQARPKLVLPPALY